MVNLKTQTQSGFLKVSKIHSLYYEVCGNPEGEAILFLHGGPGGGFSDSDKRFFNFDKQRVIFFDQRGASKSTPYGCIEENTTQHLVDDINKLLDYLKIEKVLLFGGSWGATLGLVYAIQHPLKVKGLLLRGVFIANESSIAHYLEGGIQKEFPDIWKRFSENVPNDTTQSIGDYYWDKIINGTPREKRFFAYEWAFYEISIYKKGITKVEVESLLQRIPYESLAIMETHYLRNKCFLEENYILSNSNKIKHIPVKIVHGKEDAICPVQYAVELNELLESSELFVVEGGHSDCEPEIDSKLKELINTDIW